MICKAFLHIDLQNLAGETLGEFRGKVNVTTKFGHEDINGKATGRQFGSIVCSKYDIVIIATPLWWSNMVAPMQTLPVLIGYLAIYPICLKTLPWLFFAECVTKGDLFSSYHRMANTA